MTEAIAIFPGMTRPLNLRDIFLRIPEQALGLVDFYQLLMRGPSPLSAGERELIYAYGSRAAGCHFCATSHRYCAIELGIPNDVFLLAPDQLDDAPLRAGLAALLRYTTSLVVNGHSGSAPRVGDFPIERFDRETLIDAILVAGLTAYINRVIEGLGAFSVDAQHSRNGEGLARFGYVRVREEVARSLHDAGLLADGAWRQSSAVIPAEMASRGALFRWLDSYRLLIFEGPSRIPTWLRQRIRIEADRTGWHEPVVSDSDRADPAHMAALAFAQRLVRAPVTSTPEDIQRLLAASWSERDIIDLVVAAATVAFLTRINVGIEECGVALEKSSTE